MSLLACCVDVVVLIVFVGMIVAMVVVVVAMIVVVAMLGCVVVVAIICVVADTVVDDVDNGCSLLKLRVVGVLTVSVRPLMLLLLIIQALVLLLRWQ